MLRVLSHELRGPLGVMQGYLRLLLTRRADDAADVRMLTAILEASGRITAIARDASELATWQDGRALGEIENIGGRALIEQAVTTGSASIEMSPASADVVIETPNAASLAAAIGALLQARQRDMPDVPFVVRTSVDGAGALEVVFGPAAAIPSASLPAGDPAGDREAAAFSFDRGGQGLALVLASAVLDAHGATVSVAGNGDVLTLSLPNQRGSR
jgi:light-regulated signal transduction histidine kinase (bacteriophytochrome)